MIVHQTPLSGLVEYLRVLIRVKPSPCLGCCEAIDAGVGYLDVKEEFEKQAR
jgi:hypothetical protein